MAKYRKKPIVIEAEQWFPPDWEGHYSMNCPDNLGVYWNGSRFRIDTLEGGHDDSSGDWIITCVKGERYLCKPDIFDITYELVNDRQGPVIDDE